MPCYNKLLIEKGWTYMRETESTSAASAKPFSRQKQPVALFKFEYHESGSENETVINHLGGKLFQNQRIIRQACCAAQHEAVTLAHPHFA